MMRFKESCYRHIAVQPNSRHRLALKRRGAATVWVILLIPLLVILLGVVIEIGNLWLARVELENSLESAALAAVKEWGDANGALGTVDARNVGVSFAGFNNINGTPVEIGTNLGVNPAGNPNLNALCDPNKSDMDPMTAAPDGNLVFGAVIDNPDTTITFDASQQPSCSSQDVLIEVCKANAGSNSQPRAFGVFFRDGQPGVSIVAVSLTIPVFNVNQLNQHPYWEMTFTSSGQKPVVSLFGAPDAKNLNNAMPAAIVPPIGAVGSTHDVRGMNPAPLVPNVGNPQNSNWICPNLIPGSSGICFSFSNQIGAFPDRFRTVTINFNPGEFDPPSNPMDPNTWEFIRYGVALHGLGPPAITGMGAGVNNNDGDIFELAGVIARVDFSDGTFCESGFVNTGGNDGRSEANCGGGSGLDFGVRAQAEVLVQPMFCQFVGINFGPFCVSATTHARYDCITRRPRLIRIDEYICAPGNGADP